MQSELSPPRVLSGRRAEDGREEMSGAAFELPPRALKRLLYNNNFVVIGPNRKQRIHIQPVIGQDESSR